MKHNDVEEEIKRKWESSEAYKRVIAVESFGYVHQFPQYDGKIIPDIIIEIVRDALSTERKEIKEIIISKVNPVLVEGRKIYLDDDQIGQNLLCQELLSALDKRDN